MARHTHHLLLQLLHLLLVLLVPDVHCFTPVRGSTLHCKRSAGQPSHAAASCEQCIMDTAAAAQELHIGARGVGRLPYWCPSLKLLLPQAGRSIR